MITSILPLLSITFLNLIKFLDKMAKYIFYYLAVFHFYHNDPAEKEVKKAFSSFDHIYQQTTTINVKFRVPFR
jgi:hypothetical protein